MGQVDLGHCGISIPEDGQKPKKQQNNKKTPKPNKEKLHQKNPHQHFGHGPGHPALVCPSQAGQLDQMTSRDPFQSQLSSDSMTVICQLNC